jgi:putative Mg2+ transporter-C (MgtC) family protein
MINNLFVVDKTLEQLDIYGILIVILIPIIICFFIAFFIGIERQNIGKAAGITSHIFVSLGACGISILQRLLFEDALSLLNNGVVGVETSSTRLIAQVIVGIGFVGAGVIIKDKGNVIKGITTASTIWVCAMIGVMVGSGYLLLGGIIGFIIISFLYIRDITRGVNPLKSIKNEVSHIDIHEDMR